MSNRSPCNLGSPFLQTAYLLERGREYEKWMAAIWKLYVVWEGGKLLVWKINFAKSQTYSFLPGKIADIIPSSHARLCVEEEERDGRTKGWKDNRICKWKVLRSRNKWGEFRDNNKRSGKNMKYLVETKVQEPGRNLNACSCYCSWRWTHRHHLHSIWAPDSPSSTLPHQTYA